jgi:protein involved in polysaccharide export with SLBB domain
MHHSARCALHAARVGLGVLLLAPTPAAAQDPWDPSRVYASRSGLDSLARRFELSAESPAYSATLRAEARNEAAALRRRLAEGDFQVGDRIVLTVEREATLSDSFVVEQGPAIQLPTVGRIGLAGVLRSEVEAHLATEVAKFVRSPDVRARTFVRISVVGEVGQPGFYSVATDALVTDILVQAGQVSGLADLGKIQIERAGRTFWDNSALGSEIIEGRTLDQLGVRAGDRLVVGSRSQGLTGLGAAETSLRTVLMLITLPATVLGVIAIFN